MNILITGGCGSVGLAFAKHLDSLGHDITVIDRNEWAIAQMRQQYPFTFLLGDFNDIDIQEYGLIIHCAAYKHVDLGEKNLKSFLENNTLKTVRLFEKVRDFGSEVLYISTDKSVEPISFYGMTKAIPEYFAKEFDFPIARMGNIINSSGSVIPVWEQAIAENKPLPVTSLKMKRYMIEVDDAVKQIWDGYTAMKKLIIPQMKEYSLSQIITKVLKKHGIKSIEDYKPGVKIIGLRPGEKLREKLKWDNE